MKRILLSTALLAFASGLFAADPAAIVTTLTTSIDASTALDAETKTFVKTALLPECTNAVLIKEIKAQNAKKVALEKIQEIDKTWMKAEEELPVQKEMLTNACAVEIKAIVAKNPAKLTEVFAMDDKGANVGQNALTSDYWQGDEDKWKLSYNEAKGGVDVGKAKFDKSANAQLQQVSLPIIDTDGTIVGAITYGIKVAAK